MFSVRIRVRNVKGRGGGFVVGGLRCPIMARFDMGMREAFRADEIDTCQLHELQNVEAHPDGSRKGDSVPTIDTGLGGLDHSFNIAVSHWSTMTFESFSKNLKETQGVPNTMGDFLLNQVWVQY